MKTMQDYTIYCTEEQIRKAHVLGAPLCVRITLPNIEIGDLTYSIPTTQQMIGWLEDVGFVFERIKSGNQIVYRVTHKDYFGVIYFDSCKEEADSVRAAINAALNFSKDPHINK